MTKGEQQSQVPDTGGGGNKRNSRGQFTEGNAGGPGSPLAAQAARLRRAAMEAITPEIVIAIIRRQARKALDGDTKSARLVLDRTLGRPREEGEEVAAVMIDLPAMRTAADCVDATGRILDAFTKGELSRDDAKILLDGVQLRSRTLEQAEFDQRLREIEEAVAERTGKPKRRRA